MKVINEHKKIKRFKMVMYEYKGKMQKTFSPLPPLKTGHKRVMAVVFGYTKHIDIPV